MATQSNAGRVTGWVSWVYIGGSLMAMLGIMHLIEGFVALFSNDIAFVGIENIWILNLTAWGWMRLLSGAIILSAGFAVMTGRMWGRVVGVILSTLAVIANIALIPTYPVWATIMLAVSMFVLYALIVHGSEAGEVL